MKFKEDLIAEGEKRTQIACLPTAEVGTGEHEGGNACWSAGWGRTKPCGKETDETKPDVPCPKEQETLLSVGVNVFSQKYCVEHTEMEYGKEGETKKDHFINSNDICAGIPDGDDEDNLSDGGKDSCQGDSGGPLICPINGKATLVGVVSRGSGCADAGTSGLYSATYWADSWIKTTVNNN